MIEIQLTHQPIHPERTTSAAVNHLCCGAVLHFLGVVRNENEGRTVTAIDYECYEPMAHRELLKIAQEAKEQWGVHTIKVIHRIGRLLVGETSLWVEVASPHRREALLALQYVIDELKKRVPIWKKEFYENESPQWIACHHSHS